jgi:hypothetical protein
MRRDKLHRLIQKQLDGCLSRREAVQLEEILARDSQARALHSEMTSLDRALSEFKRCEAPDSIKVQVMAAIASRPRVAGRADTKRLGKVNRLVEVLRPKFSLGLAVGTALGVVASIAIMSVRPGQEQLGRQHLVGSMLPAKTVSGSVTNHEEFSGSDVKGTLDVLESDSLINLKFKLSTQKPLEVLFAYDPTDLEYVKPDGAGENGLQIKSSPGAVRVEQTGERSFDLVLLRRHDAKIESMLELQTDREVLWRILEFNMDNADSDL